MLQNSSANKNKQIIMEDALGEYYKEEWESLRTGTGSLSILVASLRAKESLIFSTCVGRNEGNDNSAKHTVPPLRFFAITIVIVAAAKLAVRATMFSFAHPPGKLALPSRLHELQLQRTLVSSSLSVDKICGDGVLLF